MKIANQSSPLIVSEGMENDCSLMGMTQEAALRMTQHLRDTVYSNKVLAVVRELASNIFDEHNKYNVKKPAFIGIRKEGDEYEFFARDYAKGLSEENIRNVFGMYGASTKSLTNNLLGTYGIGSKVFFSISSIFSVASHFEGVKTIYSCAIGGDENGSSNGFIYKIHEEPTEESGLEVFGPIKSSDLSKFANEITKFVQLSPHGIVANILGTEVIPAESSFSKNIDGIVVKSLKDARTLHNNNVLAVLQMGGVSYGTVNLPEGFRSLDGQAIVVDLPIGSMTVALSRESFHDTPSNQNYLTKVSTILQDLADQDFAAFRAKPLKQAISENLGELYNNKYQQGSLFQAKLSAIYPDVWPFVASMGVVNPTSSFSKKSDKEELVLIPDNSATDYWKGKLRDFAKANDVSYYIGCENKYSKLNAEGFAQINEIFSTIRVKSIKFPKGKKSKAMTVYRYNSTVGHFTAVGFVNYVRAKVYQLPEELDENKLKEWIKEAKTSVKNLEQLNNLSISKTKERRCDYWYCNSSQFAKEVVDLGIFEYGGAEYYALTQKWVKQEQAKQQKQRNIQNALRSWITHNERTKNIVHSKTKNAEKLANIWAVLLKEKSTRGKVLQALNEQHERSYYSSDKVVLTRVELRAILKLQNA